ncbi:MAG: vitamin K epoxide reductase family protein [Gemmatimonadetes bacterium]|nr:vitamin K epoxide reductase family protein [Gemmatimonadota bacterium]
MKYRMGAALLSLIGLLVATYLYLFKLGMIPGLACGTGGCETVQASPWATFLGLPVALIGVLGYLGCLVLALIGLQRQNEERHWSDALLLVGATVGVGFTGWLTYAEAYLIEAWCRWCLGSAAIITLLFLTAALGWRSLRPAT